MKKGLIHFRISYFDAKKGLRKYYMNIGFESEKIADEEFARIKKQSKTTKRLFGNTKWQDRTDWALSRTEDKRDEFVKWYHL